METDFDQAIMYKEIEIKVPNINIIDIRKKIKKIGGKKVFSSTLFYEIHFDSPIKKKSYSLFRLRKEGRKVYLTLKYKIERKGVFARDEYEIQVCDFNAMLVMLRRLGFIILRERQKMREEYKVGNAKIEIDTYPRMCPYLEIEGKNKKEIQGLLGKLNISWNCAVAKSSTEMIYDAGLNPDKLLFKTKRKGK